MKFAVTVTLKKDVLDPQGKVVGQTLKNMGMTSLNQIRQGKFFEIDLKEKDADKALAQVREMCEKLLVNQIIEDFKIKKSIEEVTKKNYRFKKFKKFWFSNLCYQSKLDLLGLNLYSNPQKKYYPCL